MADAVTVTVGATDAGTSGTAAPAHAPGVAAQEPDSDVRGSLVLADRVGVKIAERVALDVDGVIRTDSGGPSVLGAINPLSSGYPSASVDMSQTAPTVALTVALSWPCAVAAVCARTRDHVADEIARLTGVRPVRVDVTVARIVSGEAVRRRRDGYIELPVPEET